jgi:hypothetical protein
MILVLVDRRVPENWVGDSVPSSTDDVSFPEIMSTFGSATCASLSDPTDCKIGTVIDISSTPALSVRSLKPPRNAKLVFASSGRMSFGSQTTAPAQVMWKDRGDVSRDFRCAANWVIAGSDQNPQFSSPSYLDIVDFSNV